ncbi:MAG: hypothetical protein OEM07_00820 [Gammaproteobacteria bacterium]|nr:hypothetical protein [Gammaproteobacteria bacterium]
MHNEDEIIISGGPLEGVSDNYDEFDEQLQPEKLGAQLIQENSRKGTLRKYQFYGPNYLLLDFSGKSKSSVKKYCISLSFLSSEPEHFKLIVWNWLYGALAGAALLILFITLAVYKILSAESSFIAGSIALTVTLICALIFVYLKRNEYIFKTEFGSVPLFCLENSKPDQKSFDIFFVSLQQAIDSQKTKIPVADRLIGELKMCRRLKDEGIIDEASYTAAMTSIFKHKQYKA